MDPNANLQEQDRLLAQATRDVHDRACLRELRSALSEWLRCGGFAPDWTKAPRAARYYGKGIEYVVGMVGGDGWISYRQIDVFGPIRLEDQPLPWQVAGLSQTASGYGRKLTSRQVAILPDGRRRRVYVTIFSNAGTAWIELASRIVTLPDTTIA